MPTHFKVARPNDSYVHIMWSGSEQPANEVAETLARTAAIPGVNVGYDKLEIPTNALWLPELEAFYARAGIRSEVVACLQRTNREVGLWQPARKPFEHQEVEASNIVRLGRRLVAFDMGTGKTATAIQAAETVRRMYQCKRPVVIIAPKFTRASWRNELYAMGAIESFNDISCLESRDLKHPSWDWRTPYIFVHYDIVMAWSSRINIRKPCFVVIDEAHRAKNGKVGRAKGAMLVGGIAPYCVALTGTPMENRPAELWHPLSILTSPWAFGSPTDFRKRYAGAEFNGHGWADTVPTNVEELRTRLADIYVRKTAEDVGLNLPPMTRKFVEVDPDGPLAVHEKMTTADMKKLVDAVRDNRVSEVLPLLTELRKETSTLKLADTVEVAANAIEQGEPVVIFTWMRTQAERISKLLAKKHRVVCVSGDIDQKKRDAAVADFQGGKYDAIVATLGALKEGVTLHRSRIVILHDMDWVPGSLRQAERRILRIGQNRACISYWMLCKKSVDMIFAAMLLAKLDAIQEVLGEEIAGLEGLREISEREANKSWQAQVDDWLKW